MQAKTGLVQTIESTKRAAVTFAKLGAAMATAARLIACAAQQQPLTAGYSPFVTGGDGASGANNCGGG